MLAIGFIGLFIQWIDSLTGFGIIEFLKESYYMAWTIGLILIAVVVLAGLLG